MSREEREKWQRIYGREGLVHSSEPARFLVETTAALEPGRALVLAMGEGRNAAWLARRGWKVDGIDIAEHAVRKAAARVAAEGGSLAAVVADLSELPLPRTRYDLVCVLHYLERALFEPVRAALRPGGAIVWETFTRAHAALGSPRNPAFLLDPGELRSRFLDFDIRRYRELTLDEASGPRAIASLFAFREPRALTS